MREKLRFDVETFRCLLAKNDSKQISKEIFKKWNNKQEKYGDTHFKIFVVFSLEESFKYLTYDPCFFYIHSNLFLWHFSLLFLLPNTVIAFTYDSGLRVFLLSLFLSLPRQTLFPMKKKIVLQRKRGLPTTRVVVNSLYDK